MQSQQMFPSYIKLGLDDTMNDGLNRRYQEDIIRWSPIGGREGEEWRCGDKFKNRPEVLLH